MASYPVQIITGQYVSPDGYIKIDYPIVVGMGNVYIQNKINNDIMARINGLMARQYHQLVDVQGYPKNVRMTMQGYYELKSNERDILSLTIGNYTIAYPAAHGLTLLKGMTFDTTTGRLYQLQELFKPGSDYVKKLSDIVALQIKKRGISTLEPFKGIAPDQDFYVADKSLVLFFQLYELTAYAYGFPFFPVSVYEIQDIIKEGGPLGKMAAGD